jgi:hypothetical protein
MKYGIYKLHFHIILENGVLSDAYNIKAIGEHEHSTPLWFQTALLQIYINEDNCYKKIIPRVKETPSHVSFITIEEQTKKLKCHSHAK